MFEFMLGMSVPFFILGALVIGVICSETESPVFAALIASAAALVYAYFHNINPFVWLQQNFGLVSISVVGYLVVGAAWSVFRWYRKVADWAKYEIQYWPNKFKDGQPETVTEFLRKRAPSPANNKYHIITWIELWPASMFWYIFSDLLMNIGRFIYERMGKIYDAIVDRAIEKLREDFESRTK